MTKTMFDQVQEKFTSGNSVLVDRAVVTAQEWAEMQKERNELAAMVGRLRQGMYEMAEDLHSVRCGHDDPVSDCLPPCYNETPPAALAEIRAEAVEAAINDDRRTVYTPEIADIVSRVKQGMRKYAQQLRNGEVE